MWGPDDAEHMLELRNIVDVDHKDIVVRLTAGGSDILREIQLSIYRLYQARLYRTFEMTEEFAVRSFPSAGVDRIEDEGKHIFYPGTRSGWGCLYRRPLVKAIDARLRVGHC